MGDAGMQGPSRGASIATDARSPAEVADVGDKLPPLDRLRLLWLQHLLGPVRRRFWQRPPLPPPLSSRQIMDRLAELEICTWTYDFEPGVRHLGPMAQDFAAAFGLGRTNRMISEVDANGVAMVAIQVLQRRVVALEREVADLRTGSSAPSGSGTIGSG